MKTKTFTLFSTAVMLALLAVYFFNRGARTQAQEIPDTASPATAWRIDPAAPGIGAVQTEDGLWMMPEEAAAVMSTPISPQNTGGPDDFGYTWNDAVPLNWIDVSGGVETGINSSTSSTGPVNIGFSFKYYENNYTQLYISRFGFVAFNNVANNRSQSRIPSPDLPNDVIAPHWVPAYGVNGYVRYLSGGSAPNRWFAVEWNRLESHNSDEPEEYTFEVILHENGDIVFQYGAMTVNGSYYCQASGIEDSEGLDGLEITDFCYQIAPNHAVRIYRPIPSARVKLSPAHYGRFTHANDTVSFQIPIRNTGDLGADTYDLLPASAWNMMLYRADGVTLLTDTDGDGLVDTGSVPQGGSVNITAKIQTPPGVAAGDDHTAQLMIRSSLDVSKSKTATLITAVPAPFVQVYDDLYRGTMSIYLSQPAGQTLTEVTSDWHDGFNPAVAETQDGNFVYTWDKSRQVGFGSPSIYATEIYYSLVDRYGDVIRTPQRLTYHSNANINISDIQLAIAVAPDGHIGLLWYRILHNSSTGQRNYNIYFAILDSAGNLVHGPANLTNNSIWGTWNDLNWPAFYSPRITATDDNRFVLAWYKFHRETAGNVTDIYYMIQDSNGGNVRGITNFTHDTPGYDTNYYSPALAALPGNQMLLALAQNGDINFAVLDSNGNIVRNLANITPNTPSESSTTPDVVRLPNGRLFFAWSTYVSPGYVNQFAVLDPAYNVIAGPTTLNNPATLTGDYLVSVTADANSNAIITWMDSYPYRNLYYALVNSNGAILTPPMIFQTGRGAAPYIVTSYHGYGNTSYSWTPPAGVDGVFNLNSTLFGGEPGNNALIHVGFANHGATTASGLTLTTTLDSNLTYVGDTSGIVPTVTGNEVVWHLHDLAFLEKERFSIAVMVPANAVYGERYPVTLTLTSSSPDENPADNTISIEVIAAHQLYLPALLKE